MSNTNNNISNPLNGCEVNRIPKIQFKETPKDKNASDYLEVKYPSGKKMVYSGYNVIDEPIIKEEGSMTRAQFEELHGQLSAKSEQRISDMLVAQTRQVIEIVRQSEQRVSDMLTTKFDQIEQKRLADKEEAEQKRLADKAEAEEKRLADKAEMNQKFNEFKSEIKQEINDFKVEVNQKFDNFKVEIRTEMNEFKSEIRTEMYQKFDLVFVTMENNQAQTNDRLDRIEQDIKMLKSFHEEDIKKYIEEKDMDNKESKK